MTELFELFHLIDKSAIGWTVIITAVLSLIQIAPIKINPWSFIARQLGRALNSETFKRLDRNEERVLEVKHDVDDLRDYVEAVDHKIDENRAVVARVRILRFNDELLDNKKHSKDAYDQVLSDIDDYDSYCDKHPEFKNNQTKMSAENIARNYKIRLKKHDFLVSKEEG